MRPHASVRTRNALIAAALVLAVGLAGCGKETPTTPGSPAAQNPPAGCTFTVGDGPEGAIAASGGEFTVTITAAAGCAWTSTSGASFITVIGSSAGSGTGSVRFTVQANNGDVRQGGVQVAGRSLTVIQIGSAPAACDLTVSPTESTMPPPGGDLPISVSVVSGTDCSWSAAANDPFISVKAGASGTGPGTSVLSLSTNAGGARVGRATIAGRTVTILQQATAPAGCAFTVSPTQTSAPTSGGAIVVTITQIQGDPCPWIAQSQSAFLTVAGNSSGMSNGSVTISAAANGGSARSGTVLVAGQTVTITQAAPSVPCAFQVGPLQTTAPTAGGTPAWAVSKTQGGTCPWTAQSQSSFITVTSGSSGVGDGYVTGFVSQNTGALRTGTLLIAGQTVTLTQNGPSTPCAFRLAPESVAAGAAQMSQWIYITVTQGENCAWSAQPSAPWVSFLGNSSGVGNGSFIVNVDANTGAARSATVLAGGQTLTVTQSGSLPSNAAAVLSFTSDPGDNIGQGQSQSFTFIGSQFVATTDQARGTLTFGTPVLASPALNLSLEAPIQQPLTTGYYQYALRFATSSQPGLSFGFNGRGCNQVTGRFLVTQAVYGAGGTVERFHARFEQHCEGHSPALNGELWIDAQGSTTPPPLAPFPATPPTPTTFFTYQSEPGDVIGGGGSGNFALANAVFTPSASQTEPEVTINIGPPTGGAFNWSLLFRAPSGQFLTPGTYDPATNPLLAGVARLRVIGLGNCSNTTGKFTVLEASYGGPGEVRRFRATFELRCGSATAAFRGEIFIVADPWR